MLIQNKADNLLPFADFKQRSGIFIGDSGGSSIVALTLFERAWDEDKKSALAFSAEAKSIMIEYLKDPSVFDVLKTPQFKPQQKMETLGKYFKETPDENLFSTNMQLLILSLVSDNKMDYLAQVLKDVFMLGFAAQHGVIGSVTTLTPLPAKARKEFTEIVKKNFLSPNDNLVLQFKASPSIQGGYVLAIPHTGLMDKSWVQTFEKFPEQYDHAVDHVINEQFNV